MDQAKSDELLRQARKRFACAIDGEQENRTNARDDIRFSAGDDKNKYQWDQEALDARKGRPCLTINKHRKFRNQVINGQRQNRISIKVRPADDKSDTAIADIFEGIIRNIEHNSVASGAYDTALTQAVDGGFGYFRILTEYSDDDSFDQDIKIKRIKNQFSVYFDPNCQEHDYSDARYAFITEIVDPDEFKRQYPHAESIDFDGSGLDGDDKERWFADDGIRVAEYFYKEPVQRLLYLLATGDVINGDKLPAGATVKNNAGLWLESDGAAPIPIIKQRNVNSHKVMWCKLAGGSQILEGPREWAGRYIPIIPVLGEEQVIDGKTMLSGLLRFGKDSQRIYNYTRSADVEMNALAPKVPYLATKKQIGAHLRQWNSANSLPFPYLLYDVDPSAPSVMPKRVEPITTQPGLMQNALICNDELKDTVGMYDASVGKQGNETSGIAITARRQQGDTATFIFPDNLSRALVFAGKILVDLIPKIWDTPRIARLRGMDGKESFVPINTPIVKDGQRVLVNDITVGNAMLSTFTWKKY